VTPFIELVRLQKVYPQGGRRRSVIQKVTFGFQGGGVYAIRGRSGSGKTTLLNLIAGLDEPSGGEVRIDGWPMSRSDASARARFRRHQIGFVFQFFHLLPTLTALENVLLPLEIAGWPRPAALTAAGSWLRRVGLVEHAGRYPDTLSGGEQQRVAIARALVHRPRLVLADEPTGNLDRATGDAILAALLQLARQMSTTVLLVTHSHRVAERCDRVLSLEDGRLRDLGRGGRRL
jgi:putative ABC transport system ATP-binding protein